MIVLVWVGWIVAALLLLVVNVVLAGLLSRVSVEGRVGPDGVAAQGRWGVIGVRMRGARDGVDVRLVGLRLPGIGSTRAGERREASDDDAESDDDATAKTPTKATRTSRRRPSLLGYRRVARTALRELRGMARHLHVERLRIDVVVATDDPATTGEVYGMATALAAWMRGTWPRAEVWLEPDFIATRPRVTAEGAVHLRPVRLVPGTVRVAWSYWTERRRSRRHA